jgi:dolichol-phosphate mannosyltransferase
LASDFQSETHLCVNPPALAGGNLVYSIFSEDRPVEGWLSIMGLMSLGFFMLFVMLTLIFKYLSVILNMLFKRQRYVVEEVEKLSK